MLFIFIFIDQGFIVDYSVWRFFIDYFFDIDPGHPKTRCLEGHTNVIGTEARRKDIHLRPPLRGKTR